MTVPTPLAGFELEQLPTGHWRYRVVITHANPFRGAEEVRVKRTEGEALAAAGAFAAKYGHRLPERLAGMLS
jgi:hypothetical protein